MLQSAGDREQGLPSEMGMQPATARGTPSTAAALGRGEAAGVVGMAEWEEPVCGSYMQPLPPHFRAPQQVALYQIRLHNSRSQYLINMYVYLKNVLPHFGVQGLRCCLAE